MSRSIPLGTCPACGHQVAGSAPSCPNCGHVFATHNRVVAALLAFFLGGFGVHKFYLGKIFQGILYLVFCWTLIPSIIAFIEMIIYLCSSDEEFARKYH